MQNRCTRRGPAATGFTLIEVMVALAILSVAVTVLATTIVSGVELAKSNRSDRVAAAAAEAQMTRLLHWPDRVAWPTAEELNSGEPVELLLVEEIDQIGPRPIEKPNVMATDRRAQRLEAGFYDRYSWEAYVRAPGPDAPYLELTVLIRWKERGQFDYFALTQAIARSRVEDSR